VLQIIRDKKTKKSKGYGIVSLLDGGDFAKVSICRHALACSHAVTLDVFAGAFGSCCKHSCRLNSGWRLLTSCMSSTTALTHITCCCPTPDLAQALKEMNGKYIGNRPCKLSRSTWKERAAPVGKGNKRPAAALAVGEVAAKVPKTGPRAKHHVPIMRH
jgi:hypothetical protein